ncbi:hypothetical protein C0J52_15853, partial [Blattella germanica]
ILGTEACDKREYGVGNFVCVCNSTYCDDYGLPPQLLMSPGQFLHYETNKDGKRMDRSSHWFSLIRQSYLSCYLFDKNLVRFEINWRKKHQTMLGFGGAMTDAAAINILSLSLQAQENLLRQYFSIFGIGYSFLRVPMAGTDFSARFYTYADDVANDTTLAHFNLTAEDYEYKIPLLHKAIKYSLLPIKLFTTSWSAPVWMTEPRLASSGNTRLQNKYYQLYADYFIKFLNAYREHGLYFWGITPQNEPIDGWLVNFGFNNLGWTPWEQREFLGYFLGPTLHANGYGNLKVVIVDDQRSFLPFWANIMLQDPKVRQFVSGIAVHWYTDWMSVSPPSLTSDTWGNFKDKFVLYTEACIIPPPGKPAVRLGNWDNAENITLRMIDAFNNMVVGWVDWNIALDEAGGPNWANNVVDALIVVNATSDEFYKQPMFYAMAHFSRFVLPGSKRIEMKSEDPKGIAHVAFRRDDNAIVIILCNSDNTTQGSTLKSCIERRHDNNSVVCVCNATYCDDGIINTNSILEGMDSIIHFMSSKKGDRLKRVEFSNFKKHRSHISHNDETTTCFLIDPLTKYQEIYGFGGAVTDAVGININSLSKDTQMMLMKQYFGQEGIGYTFIRLPIAGTDFSTRLYSYDDISNDTTLEHFQLKEEDKFKIYFTKLAQNISSLPIKVVTAPWSSPEWMKELRFPLRGHTRLKKEFYQLYADYIVKFLDEYKKQGVQFWAISPQNEPSIGVIQYYGFNSLGWTGREMKEWLRDYFGPTLYKKGYNKTKIILLDDVTTNIPTIGLDLLRDEKIRQLASGIALHGYEDLTFLSQPTALDDLNKNFPEKFLLYTESSIMRSPFDSPVVLGEWFRGEYYARCIIEDMNHWVVGWIDWNIALNFEGGPNWAGNTVDASIIVNSTADEFYKQPMFYAIAHFSKFILPGSHRIKLQILSEDDRGIQSIAFLRPDKIIVTVLMNIDTKNKTAVIVDRGRRVELEVNMQPHSLHTLLYKMSTILDEDSFSSSGHCSHVNNIPCSIFCIICFTLFTSVYTYWNSS